MTRLAPAPTLDDLMRYFSSNPAGERVIDSNLLRDFLDSSEGKISSDGIFYQIATQHIGAGIYRVWLEK